MTDRMGTSIGGKSDTKMNKCVGIWRLLERFHQGPWTELFYAQPAEASGSPRADYVVKMVTESLDAQVEGQWQLRQEAASTQATHHPNLIALLDARLSAPRPYIVFPRLDGQPLSTWLDSKHIQPLAVCLWWIRQSAQALQALHGAGWTHGDIKPDNLLVSLRGHLTLIDLGLARRCGDKIDPNRFQGTPAYAAPEVIQGADSVMPQSDIYSLGIVFHQMLSRQATTAANLKVDLNRLRTQQVPASIITLVQRMTTASASDRPLAANLVDEIFKLEIEMLGSHIQPLSEPPARAA